MAIRARGAPDLAHDGVAGIDAQAALDAAELNSVANIDPGGADIDALMAIDAVAGGLATAFLTDTRGSPRSTR